MTDQSACGGHPDEHQCRMAAAVRRGYTRNLLFRRKELQIADPEKAVGESGAVPKGNNDASYRFFTSRRFGEIGTRLSDVYAVRKIPSTHERYLVLSTAAYMMGNLTEVLESSKKLRHGFGAAMIRAHL